MGGGLNLFEEEGEKKGRDLANAQFSEFISFESQLLINLMLITCISNINYYSYTRIFKKYFFYIHELFHQNYVSLKNQRRTFYQWIRF